MKEQDEQMPVQNGFFEGLVMMYIVVDLYFMAHTLGEVLGTSLTTSCRHSFGVSGIRAFIPLDYSFGSVVFPVVLPLIVVLSLLSIRLMLASRFADDSSPVALARSLRPAMFLVMLKLSLVSAPSLTFKPMEKMARSGNFTFLPKSSSSLVQLTASVSMPLMAPAENGVLWFDMCSANLSSPMVSSATTRGYHFSKAWLFSFLF